MLQRLRQEQHRWADGVVVVEKEKVEMEVEETVVVVKVEEGKEEAKVVETGGTEVAPKKRPQ